MPLVHFTGLPGDLFDPPDSPLAAWEQAFDDWLTTARQSRQIAQPSSEATYRQLWAVWVRWCVGQDPPVRLDGLVADDLALFLASRSGAAGDDAALSPRYAWRLLHLVDRVLARHAQRHALTPNPAAHQALEARPDWRYANAAIRDPLPDHLSAGQAKRLVDFLSSARPRPGRRDAVHSWQELRNLCSVALQLGAGLGPGDVRAVRLADVVVEGGRQRDLPWKIVVPADGQAASRETPIAPWAAQLLRHWLQVRAEAGIAGPWLFPSTRSGKPWGKVAQYGAARSVLEASGLPAGLVSGGSFRLRHTFALRQLRRGRSPDEVARWLGVVDPAVMSRYQRVLMAPVDDLV